MDEMVQMLNEPLEFRDLLNGGTKFEINSNFDNPNDEAIFTGLNMDNSDDELEFDDLQEILKNPWNKSFDVLQKNMTKVDDYLYKNIIKIGNGETIPEKARVKMHYNGFWEKEQHAFDSTFMRAKPLVFITGNQEILLGLEKAAKTMTKGEEAQFLISWEDLFGVMGVPPRIKPKANGFFVIHLLDFKDIGDDMAIEKMSETEKKSFPMVVEAATNIRANGVDHFQHQKYRTATMSFHKAIEILEIYNIKDENEKKIQQEMLVKLYTNLSVCYNRLNLPLKTFCMCKELRRITDINKNCKALFQEGKAYLKINDYVNARNQLNLAKLLEPNNQEIINTLKTLNELYKKHFNEEREISRKALGVIQKDLISDKKEIENNLVNENFKKEFKLFLESFKNNSEKTRLDLSEQYNIDEINWIRETVKDMNILLQNPQPFKKNIYTLIKITK